MEGYILSLHFLDQWWILSEIESTNAASGFFNEKYVRLIMFSFLTNKYPEAGPGGPDFYYISYWPYTH